MFRVLSGDGPSGAAARGDREGAQANQASHMPGCWKRDALQPTEGHVGKTQHHAGGRRGRTEEPRPQP